MTLPLQRQIHFVLQHSSVPQQEVRWVHPSSSSPWLRAVRVHLHDTYLFHYVCFFLKHRMPAIVSRDPRCNYPVACLSIANLVFLFTLKMWDSLDSNVTRPFQRLRGCKLVQVCTSEMHHNFNFSLRAPLHQSTSSHERHWMEEMLHTFCTSSE